MQPEVSDKKKKVPPHYVTAINRAAQEFVNSWKSDGKTHQDFIIDKADVEYVGLNIHQFLQTKYRHKKLIEIPDEIPQILSDRMHKKEVAKLWNRSKQFQSTLVKHALAAGTSEGPVPDSHEHRIPNSVTTPQYQKIRKNRKVTTKSPQAQPLQPEAASTITKTSSKNSYWPIMILLAGSIALLVALVVLYRRTQSATNDVPKIMDQEPMCLKPITPNESTISPPENLNSFLSVIETASTDHQQMAYKVMLTNQSAMVLLGNLLNSPHKEIRYEAVATLWNIITNHNVSFSQFGSPETVANDLLTVARFDPPEPKNLAIRMMTKEIETNFWLLCDHQGWIDFLGEQLGSIEIPKHVSTILGTLAKLDLNETHAKQLAEKGFPVLHLLDFLRVQNVETDEKVSAALYRLLPNTEVLLSTRNISSLLDSFVGVLESGNKKGQDIVLRHLSALASEPTTHHVLFQNPKLLEGVARILGNHAYPEYLTAHRVIKSLSKYASSSEQVVQNSVVMDQVMSLLSSEDKVDQTFSVSVIQNIMRHSNITFPTSSLLQLLDGLSQLVNGDPKDESKNWARSPLGYQGFHHPDVLNHILMKLDAASTRDHGLILVGYMAHHEATARWLASHTSVMTRIATLLGSRESSVQILAAWSLAWISDPKHGIDNLTHTPLLIDGLLKLFTSEDTRVREHAVYPLSHLLKSKSDAAVILKNPNYTSQLIAYMTPEFIGMNDALRVVEAALSVPKNWEQFAVCMELNQLLIRLRSKVHGTGDETLLEPGA